MHATFIRRERCIRAGARRRIGLFGRRCPQNRRQPRHFAVHQLGERFRPAPARLRNLRAQIAKSFLHRRLAETFVEGFGEPVDDGLRRPLRRKQRIERRAIELGQALLVGGRHIRQQRAALLRGDGERLHGAGAQPCR